MELSAAVKKLLIIEPFYGIFLLGLDKHYGDICPTACVYRNGINCGLCVNKEFWDGLDDSMQLAVLKHEVNHLIFKHMMMWDYFGDKKKLNEATDCVCNSYIKELQKDPYVYPQRYKLPLEKGAKFYYENIPDEDDENQSGNGSIDDHSPWKDFQDMSDAEKELVSDQIDSQVKHTAEQVQKFCGSIPGQFKEYVEGLFKQRPAVFNWKSYFRRLLGNSIMSYLKKSRYRPSKRFDDQPGTLLKFKPKVLVAVDTSGSVSNDELSDFFTEIEHLYKSGVQVDIVEFDTRIHTKFAYTGKKTEIEIGGRGGTDATEVFNLYRSRRDYSTLVIFTDGYLNLNIPKCANVIWVITSTGQKTDYPGKAVYIPATNK